MNKKVNVLITGCGGDIGQSIIKILKELEYINEIIGCDIHDKHPSIFLVDKFYEVCRVNDLNYLTLIRDIIIKDAVELIIPCSEPELRYHRSHSIFDDFINDDNLNVIIPNAKTLHIGFDKLLTSNYLKNNDFLFLETSELLEISEPNFPCILKDRHGAGSKKIFLIKDIIEWNFYKERYENLIYQEFVSDAEGEYTCGLYRNTKETRVIIFRRDLHGGYSGYGEVYENEEIEFFLYDLAEALDLEGSINVQLRLRDGKPYVFEINPRFSSTVLFRHMLGFKDLLWCIEFKMEGKISNYQKTNVGKKFYKGFQEYIN